MKKTLPFFLAVMIILGCSQQKEIQMDMSDVELVKIDTIQRYPNATEKILTWRSSDQIDYITFAPLDTYYPLGSRMKVMMKR
jgi:hypothetical protein